MIVTPIGYRHAQGTSKDGKTFDFWEVTCMYDNPYYTGKCAEKYILNGFDISLLGVDCEMDFVRGSNGFRPSVLRAARV